MTTNSKDRPRALVTGASSGIGAAFADRLAQEGFDLVITARRLDRLEQLAEQLRTKHSANVEVLAADLSRTDGIRKIEKYITEDPWLEFLVNNAGFGGYMPFAELDPDRAEELVTLQVLAVVRLTRAALPGMIERGKGSIVNVSSRLAFSGSLGSAQLPKRATYAGTKAFINTFSQLLQSELDRTKIKIQALCPGLVETEFHERVGADTSRFPATIVMQPKDVVQASLMSLNLDEVICVPALEDPNLLEQIRESEKNFFEQSRSGNLAKRFGPLNS